MNRKIVMIIMAIGYNAFISGCKSRSYTAAQDVEGAGQDSGTPSSVTHVPNAFTPNQDGENDYFIVDFNTRDVDSASMMIYNRWGEKVYESQKRMNGKFKWDGNDGNKPCPSGVYYVHLYYREKGEDKKYTGTVTLIR